LSFVAAAAALLMLAPVGFGGGNSAQAMTCMAEPPIDTACDVGFGVLYLVCTGHVPKLPSLPITTAAAATGWPISCPPLG
jgi:hypothetical protein